MKYLTYVLILTRPSANQRSPKSHSSASNPCAGQRGIVDGAVSKGGCFHLYFVERKGGVSLLRFAARGGSVSHPFCRQSDPIDRIPTGYEQRASVFAPRHVRCGLTGLDCTQQCAVRRNHAESTGTCAEDIAALIDLESVRAEKRIFPPSGRIEAHLPFVTVPSAFTSYANQAARFGSTSDP